MVDAFQLDWQQMFMPNMPLLEIVVRGSIMYLAIFTLLRLLRREVGGLEVTDVLVIVLIADAAQNAMAGAYDSITDGLMLVGVIAFWAYLIDWLGYRFRWFERLVRPKPWMLVKNGKVIRVNMRRALVTEGELRSKLREQGIDDITDVKAMRMESDGQISIITWDNEKRPGGKVKSNNNIFRR